MASYYKEIYNKKLNPKFYPFLDKDVLGFFSFNVNTEAYLKNLPKIMESYYGSFMPRYSNMISLGAMLFDIALDLIDHVAENGGHFSSSLGVVELTIALHYVFDTPVDKLVWDVGHQAYVHKLLTGRKNFFYSNRQLGGISGFPCREESEFDAFGTGHSSTSIAAALGMAIAARHKKNNKRQHIAVIGDGAMTAGLAFEALNNVGFEQPNILIILNDNNMSIDNNVGALQNYLTKLTTGEQYNALKSQVKKAFSILPSAKWSIDVLRKLEKAIKGGVLQHSNLFEALNIRYFGPIDGHDIEKLVHTLEKLKHIPGPKILHCITTKGNGYLPAMQEKEKWHAPGKFDKQTGITLSQKPNSDDTVTFQEIDPDTGQTWRLFHSKRYQLFGSFDRQYLGDCSI